MKIIPIKNNNYYFKEIMNIFYTWFGIKKEYTKDKLFQEYEENISKDGLPYLYALIINDTLIGMYELNKNDGIEEKEYTPYLASVYIKEQYRGQGYSKYLIESAINETKSLGYNKLYLHSKHENYYEKYGFVFKEIVKTKNGDKRIYEINIK